MHNIICQDFKLLNYTITIASGGGWEYRIAILVIKCLSAAMPPAEEFTIKRFLDYNFSTFWWIFWDNRKGCTSELCNYMQILYKWICCIIFLWTILVLLFCTHFFELALNQSPRIIQPVETPIKKYEEAIFF